MSLNASYLAYVGAISRYGKEGFENHHQKEGTALTVSFEINGQ